MNWDGKERRDDAPLGERIAVLERRADDQDGKLDEMLTLQRQMNAQLLRFHGAIGALAFLITGMGVAWEIFGGWIKEHWR